ncbi:MAG: FUSC family protein, partial [Thermoplasmata archaeon]
MAEGGDEDGFALEQDRTFLTDELATGVLLATAHARMVVRVDASIDDRVIDGGAPGPAVARSAITTSSPAAKWARRAGANLRPDSIHLRNSLRLAVGLSLARILVGVLNLEHGFWVAFSTLTVLRSSASGTTATSLQALAGTLIGFGASTAMALAFGSHGVAYYIALPIVLFLAMYAGGVVSFVIGQVFFTMTIVVLFNLLQPEGWRIGLFRLEDVASGAAIGVLIGLAIWPRGAGGQLGRSCASLLAAGSAYARATVRDLLPDIPSTPLGTVRQRALDAAVRAEDVFAEYLSERRDSPGSVRAWARVLVGGHRLW